MVTRNFAHLMTASSKKRGSEVRISSRHAFEKRMSITLQRPGQQQTVEGWTRNLSEGGLNAFVAHNLHLGELVTLEVQLSQSGKQSIPAKVVRKLGTEYGFQFTAVSVEQRSQIQAVLKDRPEIPHTRNER
jgi:hypothetical protein